MVGRKKTSPKSRSLNGEHFAVVFSGGFLQSFSCVWLFVTPRTAAARLPGHSRSPRVCSDSCPSSQWCSLPVSSSAARFSFCFPFPASGSLLMSQLFKAGGQSIRTSASVLPMNIQGWFPLGLTDLISLLSKGLSKVQPLVPSSGVFCGGKGGY